MRAGCAAMFSPGPGKALDPLAEDLGVDGTDLWQMVARSWRIRRGVDVRYADAVLVRPLGAHVLKPANTSRRSGV